MGQGKSWWGRAPPLLSSHPPSPAGLSPAFSHAPLTTGSSRAVCSPAPCHLELHHTLSCAPPLKPCSALSSPPSCSLPHPPQAALCTFLHSSRLLPTQAAQRTLQPAHQLKPCCVLPRTPPLAQTTLHSPVQGGGAKAAIEETLPLKAPPP